MRRISIELLEIYSAKPMCSGCPPVAHQAYLWHSSPKLKTSRQRNQGSGKVARSVSGAALAAHVRHNYVAWAYSEQVKSMHCGCAAERGPQ